MPGLALYGVREEELGRAVELWAEDESSGSEGEEGGPGPPPRAVFFHLSLSFFFFFLYCRGRWVEGGEYLIMTAQAGPRLGKWLFRKSAAAMALRAPSNGI